MSPEAIALGVLSAVRATPLAIVYAFLAGQQPRRLLTAYVIAGLVVSLVVGIAIVTVLGASTRAPASSTTRDVVDIIVGIGALSYTAGFWSGRIGNRPEGEPRRRMPFEDGRLGRRLRSPSWPLAAGLGAVTNLPGLFYLAGLVAILGTDPTPVNGVVQVVIYNILRFATPFAALGLVLARPDATRSVVESLQDWTRRNSRLLIVLVFGGLGIYLTVKGLVGLLG
ncbi:GAP family protein [Actinomycetospora sp.]|uniref:GAP family protein n=1 Tax=Actinomycetospora sp. TaxID=1872135 RepID=UPI002F412180